MKHKVKIGRDNKLYGLKKDSFKEGDKVSFYIMVASDTNYYVTSKEVDIKIEDSNEYSKVYYSFIMPNKDVVVNIDTKNDMTCLNIVEDKKEVIKDKDKIYCKDCGLELEPGIKFCPECGCRIEF